MKTIDNKSAKITDNKPTRKQTWALFLSTGVDCRNCNLTKEFAAELIIISQTDPKKACDILIAKGGDFKNELNLKYAIRRVEKKGVAFTFKKKQKPTKIIVNSKTDKKIQAKIRKKIKTLSEEMLPKFKTELEAFTAISDILNNDGYRCCDGSEWKYKSVYDFYRRNIFKSLKKVSDDLPNDTTASPTEVEISCGISKDTLIKCILESNIDTTSKVRLITLL